MTMTVSDEVLAALQERIRVLARAVSFRTRGAVDADELFSIGECAIVPLLEKYNAEQSGSFAGYALQRARGAMLDYLREVDPTPRRTREQAKIVRGKPEEDRTAEDLRVLGKVRYCVSWEGLEDAEAEMSRLEYSLSGVPAHRQTDTAALVPALLTLDPVDAFVVWQRNAGEATLEALGLFLGVSLERVRQVEERAAARFRVAFLKRSS